MTKWARTSAGVPSWSLFDSFRVPLASPRPAAPSWSIFTGFERPKRRQSWGLVHEFVEHGRRFAAARCRAFPELLRTWDAALDDLEGDPSHSLWSQFRPLRTDREEDWSDWLQHFIATSDTGAFSFALLKPGSDFRASGFVRPEVIREEIIDDRRADLVIRWATQDQTHIEVKVGDQNFAKTFETASKLQQRHGGANWTHYILLPAQDVELWDRMEHPQEPIVRAVTWDDVTIALRRSLRGHGEGRRWRTWAHGFCGLIEQRLLGHPEAAGEIDSMMKMARRVHQIAIMKRGLDDF